MYESSIDEAIDLPTKTEIRKLQFLWQELRYPSSFIMRGKLLAARCRVFVDVKCFAFAELPPETEIREFRVLR